MAGLTIKISADTQSAVTQFKELAGSSDAMAAAIEKANAKFASADIQKFTDKQKLAQAALTATRGETGAVEASIGAYQRKIEALVKQGLSPESEQVKTLVSEMETLRARKDAAAAASEAQAQREAELAAKFEEAAKAAEQEADIAARSLDAKSGLEKENIRLAAEQDRVRESIKKLVASGMDPESAEVKNLEAEYKGLTREIETNTKARETQENAAKGAATALAAIAAAAAAAIGYSVTQAAKVEDMTAAYTTLLGSQEKAAELVKRINKEAATTPFEIESISGSMNKLLPLFKGNSDAAVKTFRMIGDTAGGNAQKLDTLTDAYAKVQMKGKASMSELNRISNAGVPIFDVLSETLGVTTEGLFEMSKEGDITAEHLTAAFQKMTSEGGTFFNGMENSSDTFNMRLLGIKENAGILAAQIGEKFLPVLKDVAGAVYDAVSEFSEWIGEGDNLDRMLEGVGYALAGVTAGLAAFLAVSKGAAVLQGLAAAFKGLTGAMAANPIGAIAVVITAVLIPALIALYKNWDTVVTYIAQGTARIEWFFKSAGSVLKEAFIVSVNAVKGAFWSLTDLLQKNLLGAISKLLGALEKIPLVGKAFEGASKAVAEFSKGVTDLSAAHQKEADAAIKAAKAEQDAAQKTYNEKVALIDRESQAKRDALKKIEKEAEIAAAESVAVEEAAAQQKKNIAQNVAAAEAATLAERLEKMGQTEAQSNQERLGQFSKYLADRVNAQFIADEADLEQQIAQTELKKEFLNRQFAEIQASDKFSRDEKLLAEQALAAQLRQIDEETAANVKKLNAEKLDAAKTLYSGMKDLIIAGLGESRAAAIAERVIAAAESAINTALAATKALASGVPPWNYAAAAGVVAAGVAQQMKINSTPIPSAETGGRFMVPETFTGVDSGLMRVNRGEAVDITPRGGGAGDAPQRIVINIDGRTFIDFMNDNLRGGAVYETSPAWNMGAV
jgi:tape measure domain-containing protein